MSKKPAKKINEKRIIWKLEKRKLSDLQPHEKNPRNFTEKGLKDLEQSIDSIGFAQPININLEGTILSGHARVLKLEQMGYEEVDVYVPDRTLTPKQEEEILVRMNANTAGEFDMDKLANEFELEDLKEWGLDLPDIEELNLSDKNKEIDIDELDTSECKIVFKFDALTYESISSRIRRLKEENNFETNEILLLELLQNYES